MSLIYRPTTFNRACNIIKQMLIDIEDREKMHEKMYSLLPIITRAQRTMKNKLAFKIGKLKGLYKLWDRIYWKISLKAQRTNDAYGKNLCFKI